ncbi:hypothetical protein ACE6H2_001269 [Prunus campanulata]
MSTHTEAKVYYGAAPLTVLGEAGRSATLQEFLEDQYFSEQKEGTTTEENYLKRLETRKEALWRLPWFLGALLAVLLPTRTWEATRIDESTWKARQDYLQIEQEQRGGGEIGIVTRGTSSSSYSPEEAQRKKFWPLIKLKDEKGFFTEVIAMCSAFFAYSLVEATRSTFFFEQMSNLDSQIGSIEFLSLYFTVLKDFSSFLISFLYKLLIPKHWRKATGTLTLVRIGCGLACSMLCCVAAWQVEGKRLKAISNEEGLEDDTSKTIPKSISWLLPQFVLLGVMEGLGLNGLTDFLADRIANNDALRAAYYASHISDLIILFRRSWFHHNINGSRLDHFFELLTYLSLVNLICYVCISLYFYRNNKSRKSANNGDEQGIDAHENGDVEAPEQEIDEDDDKEEDNLSGSVDFRTHQSAQEV